MKVGEQMEKTLAIHLSDQSERYTYLLAKHAVEITESEWCILGQVALDIVNGRITE